MLDHAAESVRFDPDGHYVRRWLPVLARLPAKWIHRCAQASLSGLLGQWTCRWLPVLARLPAK